MRIYIIKFNSIILILNRSIKRYKINVINFQRAYESWKEKTRSNAKLKY